MKKMSGGSGFGWFATYAIMALAMVAMLVACVTGKVVRIANGTLATIVVLLLLFGVVGCFCKAKALWKQLHGTTATPPAPAEKKLSKSSLEARRAAVNDKFIACHLNYSEVEEEDELLSNDELEYEAILKKARSRILKP